MKLFVPALTLTALVFAYTSCVPQLPEPPTVTTLDKNRYAGEWHEVARLPNQFEKDLVAAKATYGVNPDGSISVHNEGLKSGGETTSIRGTAKPAEAGDAGKLLVRFDRFPANLFAGDYWILDVNDNYTRALVGSPDKKFLWILSKNPADIRDNVTPQITKAKGLGFDTENLFFNPQRITN